MISVVAVVFLLFFTVFFHVVDLLVINNKTVVCLGGPGTYTDVDLYNEAGFWNRTHHPTEPQQIHISWVSDGKAFTVQFSTMEPIHKSRLLYWTLNNKKEEPETVHESVVNY
jgi:hypothetical protein